ncbi:PilZ domain-containing protein [Brucepastera parasyntrophica]|uniref:PilZ domain-containing protein n=1 Tax=Brucepastera parasyntrophica TaxID=2880008 RepID=UPI00210A07D3|nr:PilZ domain-containing protein [Brucepastera parasyntrophica]ULQ59290.1 PilZ domain-containing protein [Brucepastera parasyntrophica]
MGIEHRRTRRFHDFVRIKVDKLNKLPGFLENISEGGCRVHFSNNFPVDMNEEYTLTILPAPHTGFSDFSLTVKPEWVRKNANSVDIGFSVLHSPGFRQYIKYVHAIAACEIEEEETQEILY